MPYLLALETISKPHFAVGQLTDKFSGRSRAMVKAVEGAGGQPLYQEFTGVDHDSDAEHAYSPF